jgi:undecaprenyl-diphosphatase
LSEFQAFVLGLVQGLTEFLPVSSSGHLVVFQDLMGLPQDGLFTAVALHVATLGSVLVYYRRRVGALVVGAVRGDADAWSYIAKLAVATVPAVAVVLALGDYVDAAYRAPWVAGFGLVFTGIILWTTRRTLDATQATEPSWWAALWMGCAQSVAIIPGISRSGATVATGLALGVRPAAAAEFSFLMSAVAIAGATVREVARASGGAHEAAVAALLVGTVVAFASGVAAIWFFVRLLRTHHFHRFAWYVWAVGLGYLAWLAR